MEHINTKESEHNYNNNSINYNVKSEVLVEYKNTIEYKKIKELIDEDNLLYVTDYLKNLLSLKKDNNESCFEKKNQHYDKNVETVVLYTRLSREDLEKEKGNVSKSILNQLLMLLTYAKERNWKVVAIFYEEDISGSREDRPEWNKSLKFCELSYTKNYLCKTQARFARSMEFVGKYVHKKFIEWNVRFITIVDNIDNARKENKKNSQVTALTDEWKLEEQSENTKYVLRAKNSAGQWTGSFAPYGYKEDPNDQYHLIIDEPAAKIVRKIYDLFINGNGYNAIVRKLNAEHVLTPSKYKKENGYKYYCPTAPNGSDKWNKDTVRKILMDETYDGVLIQHRTEIVAYNIKGRKKIPKEEQIMIASMHENIVDPEVSSLVRKKFADRKNKQALLEAKKTATTLVECIEKVIKEYKKIGKLKKEQLELSLSKLKESMLTTNLDSITEDYQNLRNIALNISSEFSNKIKKETEVLYATNTRSRSTKNGEIHIFSQKVYCKCCGKSFHRNLFNTGPRNKKEKKPYLQCRTRKIYGKEHCENKNSIRMELLEEVILKEINNQISKYFDKEKIEKNYYDKQSHSNNEKNIETLKKEQETIEKSLKNKQAKFALLYEDKINGILSQDEFLTLKTKNNEEIENLTLRINQILSEISILKESIGKKTNIKKIFEQYKELKKLDRKVIDTFISKIIIGPIEEETKEREIKIIWNYSI